MSQLYIRPFMDKGSTVNSNVGLTSASVAVTRPNAGIQSIRVLNKGSNTIFIAIGDSTVTAAVATGMPILPYSVETFMLPNGSTHVACISDATGNVMYVTTGESA